MNMNYYPEFDQGWLLPLRLVFESMQGDPLWLERNECPYDKSMVDALRGLWLEFKVKAESKVSKSDLASADDKWTQLAQEMTSLFDDLKDFSSKIVIEDVKEQMAYFRTATALLDKITGLAERIHNVKTVSDFRGRVLQVFDEVLSPEQRTIAMEKLAQ